MTRAQEKVEASKGVQNYPAHFVEGASIHGGRERESITYHDLDSAGPPDEDATAPNQPRSGTAERVALAFKSVCNHVRFPFVN